MSDEPQSPVPEEISPPTSPQEPTPDAPIPPSASEPTAVPPEVPEGSGEAKNAVPVNNDNGPPSSPENSQIEQTAQIEEVEENKPVLETPTQPTAQVVVNEPFAKRTLLARAREMIQFIRKIRKK